MDKRFSSGEWIMLTPQERIQRCRIMAGEARALAATERPTVADGYKALADKWLALAEEMERVLEGDEARARKA